MIEQSLKMFFCKKCNYTCYHKGDWNKHVRTEKHNKISMDNNHLTQYICMCGKRYTFCSGLSKHKKKCAFKKAEQDIDMHQEDMEESIPKMTGTINKYNLNLFLKEQDISTHNQVLQQWKKENPQWEENDTLRDQYIQLTQTVMNTIK